MSAFRRLRGLAGIAAIWAVAWFPLGVIMGIYRLQGLQHGWQFDMTAVRLVGMVTVFWMVWGALTGLVFGGILIGAGRKEGLTTLSVRRVGFWGSLAGVVPPSLVMLLSGSRREWSSSAGLLWFLSSRVPLPAQHARL